MINAVMAGIGLLKTWVTGRQQAAKETAKATAKATTERLAGVPGKLLVVVLSYPFVSMFIPHLAPHTHAGFSEIALLPDWYVNLFMGVVCTVFSVKGITGRGRR